ncbi:biotin/lipoyl-binding protein [uncultured Lamprocystis sp.]|jgi:HlyD family secretion protein|uniref:biotin/lipoyl-binding protein n=1 Tax=uncultured Lamprocystis sp. TaxID=543132 RepID=UPI0025ED0365|nr:biotin/lipoyl-binding protein [uncultured Lamprocystis sp.]
MSKQDHIQSLLGEFLPDAQAIEQRAPPRGRRITLYALLALMLTTVVWASVSEIDKLVVAHGRLVTPLPNLVVQPLEPGILKSIDVRIGQVVRQGEVLAQLDPTFTGADTTQLSSRSATLSLQAERLESELAGSAVWEPRAAGLQQQLQVGLLAERRAAYDARMRQFDETIRGLHASLETNERDQQALARQVKSLADLEQMHLALETKQMGSKANLLQVQAQRLEVERDHTMAVNRHAEIERQIAATQAERDTFTKSWRQEAMEQLSTALQQRDEVNEQLAKAKRRSELVTLSAPADAIVLEIGKKSVGSVVQNAEALFVLVPLDAPLEADTLFAYQSDTLDGGTGDDLLQVWSDTAYALQGGTGTDTVEIISSHWYTGNFSLAANGIEIINGNGQEIYGTVANEAINFTGITLNQVAFIDGQGGNDTLTGSAGADLLLGNAGDDSLNGGAGTNGFNGGDGDDTLDCSFTGTGGIITLPAGVSTIGGVSESFSSIENVIGSSGADTITGSAGNNRLDGNSGNDAIAGGDGDDTTQIALQQRAKGFVPDRIIGHPGWGETLFLRDVYPRAWMLSYAGTTRNPGSRSPYPSGHHRRR